MRKYLLAFLAWAVVTSAALGQTVTPNFDITSTNGGGGGGGGVTSVSCTPIGGVACTVASPTAAAVVTVDTSGALTPSSVTTSAINGTPTIALTNATGLPVSTGLAGLGTGVAGALAVNVGSAGAPVVNGGALGTPSSGVLTNASGTAASLTAGHVTTNANLTGDVTSVGNAATVVKINGTSLSGLATGIVKNTTATGVPSIAIAADFPTLNQSTTGSAATLSTGRTISITGDLAYTSPSFDGSGNVTAAGTLASVVAAGTCTSCNLTFDAKGRATAIASGAGGGATLGANTFTDTQTITQGTANHGILASTGYSLTGSNAQNMVDLAGTLNTSGSPVGIKLAWTNTASGASTKFLQFLAGASGTTEVFNVTKAGDVNATGQVTASGNQIRLGDVAGGGNGYYSIYADNTKIIALSNSTTAYTFTLSGMVAFADSTLGYNQPATVAIGRAASGLLSIEDGTSATSTGYRDLKVRQHYVDFTNTATIGAVTINKGAGQAIVAASGTSVVVTDSLVTANSQVLCTIAQNDATAILKNCVAGSGSFTITLSAAATANTAINFFVLNQ